MKANMFRQFWVLLIVASLVLPYSTIAMAAAGGADEVKIGDVTKFTGEVLVKSKGEWMKLERVPMAIHSSDKIVTKRGRAEVAFNDGGVLRVDLDSNVTIIKKTETEGAFIKKEVSVRTVNVLVGSTWFDVKLATNQRMEFKTPTMTAAIRGTSGGVEVDEAGQTKGGLERGSWDTQGRLEQKMIPAPKVAMDARMLPPSNPRLANSKPMQTALKSADAGIKARGIKVEAKTNKKNLKNFKQAQERPGAKVDVAKKAIDTALAAVKSAESAKAGAVDSVSKIEADLAEAQLLGDAKAVAALEQTLAEANKELAEISKEADTIQAVANNVIEQAKSGNVEEALKASVKAETLSVSASAVEAKQEYTQALSTSASAVVSGDTTAIAAANKAVTEVKAVKENSEQTAEATKELTKNVDTQSVQQIASTQKAVETVANAAEANVALATAVNNVATNVVSQDAVAAQKAVTVVAQTSSTVQQINAAVNVVIQAAATGDIKTLNEASNAINEASESVTDQVEASETTGTTPTTPTAPLPVETPDEGASPAG